MTTLAETRQGLEDRLKTITGLHVYRRWPDSIVAPAALVRRSRSRSRIAFGNRGTFVFEVVVIVRIGDLARAQDSLDSYTDFSGTNSIIAAIEGDESLGGTSDLTEIGEWGPDEGMEFPELGPQYLSATLPVEVSVTW